MKPAPSKNHTSEGPITRADIEAKLQQIAGSAGGTVERTRSAALSTAITVATVAVVLAYVVGRRRGRRTRTFLEIRRV